MTLPMQPDPLDDEIKKLISAGATDEDIVLFIQQRKSAAPAPVQQEPQKLSLFQRIRAEDKRGKAIQRNALLETGAKGLSNLDAAASFLSEKTGIPSGGGFGRLAETLRSKQVPEPEVPDAGAFQRVADFANRFIGSSAVAVPVGAAASAALAPASAATIGAATTRALAGTAMSEAAKKAIVAGVSAIP